MCTVLLPPVVNPIAVNKYINQIYQYYDILSQELVKKWKILSRSIFQLLFNHLHT